MSLTGPDGQRATNVDAHVLQNGRVMIVALQALVPWGAPGAVGVQLASPGLVYDMRHPGPPRQSDHFEVARDPIEPTILAISASPLPAPTLSGPDHALPGGRLVWRVGLDGPTPADVHAMRVELLDPAGALTRPLSGVLRVGSDGAEWTVLLPASAIAGQWSIQVSDILAGRSITQVLAVGALEAVGNVLPGLQPTCNPTPP